MAQIVTITNPLTGQPAQVDQLEHTAQEIDDAIARALPSTDYPGCYYRTVDGVVEWLNPPMSLGIEYRTTERYLGKPVYVKLVDCGALPNNTYKEVAHGVSNIHKGVQAYGEANGLVIPTNNFGGGMASGHSTVSIRLDRSYVVIASNFDASAYTARVTIKYTKATD